MHQGKAPLAELLWLQVSGCRDLFGATGWPHSPLCSPDFGETNGLTWQRKQLCAEAARNPGQAAAGAACGWDFVHGRLSLPGAAEMGSMQGGWNSLFTFPTSVFWAKYSILTEREAKEKQERSISQGIFQSRDALELLRAKSALLLNILLPSSWSWEKENLARKWGRRVLTRNGLITGFQVPTLKTNSFDITQRL